MRVRSLIVTEDVWYEFKDLGTVYLPKCEAVEPTDIPN